MSKYSSDIFGLLRGVGLIASASLKTQEQYIKHILSHSSVREAIENGVKQTSECTKNALNNPSQEFQNINHFMKESVERSSVVVEGLRQYMSNGKNSLPIGSIEFSDETKTKSFSSIKNIQNLDIASITLKELENMLAEHNKIREVNLRIEEKPKKKEVVEEVKKVPVIPSQEVVQDEKQVESMMKFITNFDREQVKEKTMSVPVPEVSHIYFRQLRTTKKYKNSNRLRMLAPINKPKIPPTDTKNKYSLIKMKALLSTHRQCQFSL